VGNYTFYIVDVFTEEKYSGNQLAVFRNAQYLTDIEMQQIAREMNYSETTFIETDTEQDGGYNVRIFTPQSEIPFAGHPTLGTAYIIHQEIIREPVRQIVLNLKVGQIPVAFTYDDKAIDMLWMQQKPPVFYETISKQVMAKVLNLELDDIDDRFPIREVSTGLPFIMVPLKNAGALKKAHLNNDLYFQLISDLQSKAVLIFCPETYNRENDLSVRVFADYYGVAEDPATGSANGCLAGYLVHYRYFNTDDISIRVEQGTEIGRPSLLFLDAQKEQGEIRVSVGGAINL